MSHARTGRTPEEDRLETVATLVAIARADWAYDDLYLAEAGAVLEELLPPDRYQALLHHRADLDRLSAGVADALRRGEWEAADALARRGAQLKQAIERSARLLELGTAVFGPRAPDPNATALALSGAVGHSVDALAREVARLADALRRLGSQPLRWSELYRERAEALATLRVDPLEGAAAYVDPAALREDALRAAEEGAFEQVVRLAREAVRQGLDARGRARPRAPGASADRLAEPVTTSALRPAVRLGLEPLLVPEQASWNGYLSCRCAESPSFPSVPLGPERGAPQQCTCGHACPPDVTPALRASLDALMLHPFVTSGGARYLPWFGSETALLETFPEERSDANGTLLRNLGLPQRAGLTRAQIDDALLRRGPALCDEIGLDPREWRVVCVPFDVYARLADALGFGGHARWTHFDGYQLTGELHLQALVGGDARYGGAADLCSVGRSYDSPQIVARLAVVRRARLVLRGGLAAANPGHAV
jgi:hypothetical protein